MASTTRTLNPLHFEDLEPHRFEDLIRQLVYDFRPWKRLEPTGRLGADDGIDIRGVEAVSVESPIFKDVEEEEDVRTETTERLWVIQCKREKSVGPADVKRIVEEAIPDDGEVPYGFILAAACEFSKRSRDTFVLELRDRGVEEFYIWGKADLEDQLVLPKNDHLLFAYFGISLQIRRRNLKTATRSRIATKKAVRQLFPHHDPVRIVQNRFVVIDANWEAPIYSFEFPQLIAERKISFCQFLSFAPDRIYLLDGKFLASIHKDQEHWDALFACNLLHLHAPHQNPQGFIMPGKWTPNGDDPYTLYGQIDSDQRKVCESRRLLHLDQIVVTDELGHCSLPGPIILIEPFSSTSLFEPYKKFVVLDEFGANRNNDVLFAQDENRADLFGSSPLRGNFPQ